MSASSLPRRGFMLLALGLFAVRAVAAQEQVTEKPRTFIFQIGVGSGSVSYGAADADLAYIIAAGGLGRIDVLLDIGLGWAVRQNLYVGAAVDGVGTRLYDIYGDYVQLNSYIYGALVRYYPFTTGLVLGVEAGPAREVLLSSVMPGGVGPWGWGLAVSAAYDFGRKRTGFSLVAGVKAVGMSVGDAIAAGMFFLDVCWK